MRTVAILLLATVGCHGFNFLSKPKPAATASKGAKPPPKAKAVAASTKGIKKVVAPPKGKGAPAAKKPAFANPFAAKSKAAPAPAPAKKGGFSFGGAKPAAKAKDAAPPPPKPSKGKAPPAPAKKPAFSFGGAKPAAKAKKATPPPPKPTFNKPKRQSQGAPGTPGGIQFAPSKPQARSSGRKFDEFLYDPNDELAKARAAFGKK